MIKSLNSDKIRPLRVYNSIHYFSIWHRKVLFYPPKIITWYCISILSFMKISSETPHHLKIWGTVSNVVGKIIYEIIPVLSLVENKLKSMHLHFVKTI